MFKKGSRLRRRPSASMVVACIALFVALSGGAYAAVAIPADSVGFAQLKSNAVGFRDLATGSVGTRDVANNAITYTKIAKGQIGHARVSQSQIQWRVTGKCAGEYAVQSVSDTGGVTCEQTLPTDYTTAGLSDPITSPTSATALAAESLPSGSAYEVTSTPYIEVNGSAGTQNVTVTCEIVAGSQTETRSVTFALGANHEQAAGSVPLSVDLPASASTSAAASAAVACVRGVDTGAAPIVQGSAGIDATQTAGNVINTTTGTSSTQFSITTPTTTTTATTTTTGTTT